MDNNVPLRTVRADLHNHLRTSSWVNRGSAFFGSDLSRLARKARKKLGAGAVVGLIDFGDSRYEQTISSADDIDFDEAYNHNAALVPEYDLLVIHGQEIPTQQGHLLVLGTPKDIRIPSHLDVEETIARAKDLDGIIVADHPFYRDGLAQYILEDPVRRSQLFDAFEVHNGEAAFGFDLPFIRNIFPPEANSKAIEAYFGDEYEHMGIENFNLTLAPIYTSDGHSFVEIGSSYTEMKMPRSYDELLHNGNVSSYLRNSLTKLGLAISRRWNEEDSKYRALRYVLDLGTIVINGKIASKLPHPLSAPFSYFDDKFHGTSKSVEIH